MKKPDYAIAMELRMNDKDLNKKFLNLPDKIKWKWLAYACNHKPFESLGYAQSLVNGDDWN